MKAIDVIRQLAQLNGHVSIEQGMAALEDGTTINLQEIVDDADEFAATEKEIGRAREEYGSNEITIDDDAEASRGDDGTWVQAWVFLEK